MLVTTLEDKKDLRLSCDVQNSDLVPHLSIIMLLFCLIFYFYQIIVASCYLDFVINIILQSTVQP